MSQNVTQNAETAEENAERKKKKKEREEEEEEMEISSSRPRPGQIQAGDTGRTRRSRSHLVVPIGAVDFVDDAIERSLLS